MLRIFFFLLLSTFWTVGWASSSYQIFILHSYSQEYPWTKNQNDSFISNYYAKTDKSTLISTEYLDTKRRKFDKNYKDSFQRYLKNKYDGYTPDLIYITDDNALTYALEYFNDLFKSVPVIFSGVNNFSLHEKLDSSRFTGVYEKKDILKNIEILKALDPKFNKIIIVGDDSNTYALIEEKIKLQLKKYPEITAQYIANQNIEGLTKDLKKSKGKYIFLTTLGKITDSIGNTQTLKNIISQIANAGEFSIISMEDNYLQQGVLGGYVTSGKLQGKTAANMVLKFQQTGMINKIPAVTEGSNEYVFNYLELIKNNFILPQGIANQSVILNKPLSFYQRNRVVIIGVIVSLTSLLIISMLMFLIMLARKNRLIQASTYKEQELGCLINEATKKLLAERQKLNLAQSITHIGNYCWDINSNTTSWSDELYHILGYTPGEIQSSYDAYVKSVHPGDKEKFLALTGHILKVKDGYQSEYRIIRPNGEVRYVYEQGEVKLDSNNTVVGLDGVIQDITHRKQDEVEHARLQRELNQSRKMEALGQLTGGIAHDFNNMLGIIIGYSNLALDGYKKVLEPKVLSYFENINHASLRASDLVNKMMVFSRDDLGKSEALNLEKITNESIQMLRSVIPSSIEIIYHHDENLPKVMMDNVQMQQIIMNLCLNAKDAMNDIGTMEINLRLRSNTNHECIACHKKVVGAWVELSVSDTGSGISSETIENIFDPFFTTKDVSKGTGMGLAVVHSIVDQHGGHILLDTETDKGSTFHILFPVINTTTSKQDEVSNHNSKSVDYGNNEKILVVDDEPMLTDIIRDCLASYNYQGVVKNSSIEALQVFEEDPNHFSLLITDQTMPKMTGTELIEKIRNLKHNLPVILLTGYSDTINKSQAESMNVIYMKKPVDTSALLAMISTELKKI